MVSTFETKKWINEICNKGLEIFIFSDLKEFGLAHKRYLEKAASLDLIRKSETVRLDDANKTHVTKWKIQKNVRGDNRVTRKKKQ
jgi:hypothetical protein